MSIGIRSVGKNWYQCIINFVISIMIILIQAVYVTGFAKKGFRPTIKNIEQSHYAVHLENA